MSLLKAIFRIFKNIDLKAIDISSLKHINILFSGNKHITYQVHDNRKFITIHIPESTDTNKLKVLQQAIKKEVLDQGSILLEEKAEHILIDFLQIDSQKENKNFLEFFKGKIPSADLEILRASIYVDSVYRRGQSVSELKLDIIKKYGERGKNIVNLYTAGYFETIIKPLYQEMIMLPDFSPEKFIERYNTIVMQFPFAVFVNNKMTQQELLQEVEKKIEINKKYGIKQLNIHGIGEDNITKIQELLLTLRKKISWPPVIDSDRKFITVQIHF